MLSGLVLDISMVVPSLPFAQPAAAKRSPSISSTPVTRPTGTSSASTPSGAITNGGGAGTTPTSTTSAPTTAPSGRLARIASVSNKIGGALGSLFSPTAAATPSTAAAGARLEVTCRQRAAGLSSQRYYINSQGIIASKLSSGNHTHTNPPNFSHVGR
jgi:hypothetical protein